MARYNRWMNAKIYGAAAELDDEQRTQHLGAFFGSIHGTLNHLLLADRVWLGRISGDAARFESRDAAGHPIAIRGLDQILYADFGELRRQRALTDDDVEAVVASLTEERLLEDLEYTRGGQPQRHPLWWALSQLFNHQTHHRGQVTALLTRLDADPGVTDLMAMLRG